ncbi:MAG: DUF4417 domain-containing protein [Clostridia bacterium]|nr:DUF4417 domain-containing protein [Clostridia bacterium]MBQ8926408.1 DUF4417 domain-containing protein [Clostridia bacterium]
MPKITNPYARDVFLAYLIKGARRTCPDGYPIIERWMVSDDVPDALFQWDCRSEVLDPSRSGMSFYCRDDKLTPVLNNPRRYIEPLKAYQCVVGMDASPFDNMPLVVQKSQIYTNLAITYFYGMQGIKVIPNVRLGDNRTIGMLDAIPRGCLVAVGTNGFMKELSNRQIFTDQVSIMVDVLRPKGILVYGQVYPSVFDSAINNGVDIYQYDSHTMRRNEKVKSDAKSEGVA